MREGETVFRSFKYQLKPTVRQAQTLSHLLAVSCEVYNAALEERKAARAHGISITKFDQQRQVKDLKETRPDVLQYGVVPVRGSLHRLDLAFQAFFRRVKQGQTPGYPRFKARQRFTTVSYDDTQSWAVVDGKLRLQGIGHVKLNVHRPLLGMPKTLSVTREGKRWFAIVQCADVPAGPRPETSQQIGIDLGLAHLATTSDGLHIENPRTFKAHANALASAQRSLALKKRGSNRRKLAVERVAKHHRKIRNIRMDRNHKLSRELVDAYAFIALEELKITNMTRSAKGTIEEPGTNVAAKSGLNRSILDVGWGQLTRFVLYKAEEAGRDVVLVNPRNTSVTCFGCGYVDKGNRLSQAEFKCGSCGYTDNADVNAAKNILKLGLTTVNLRASVTDTSG